MENKIKKYVTDVMKNYGVSGRKIKGELVSACLDEYGMQLEAGADQHTAFNAAVANIEEIVKSMAKPGNKYTFTLCMGILSLVVSIGEMLASLLSRSVYFYNTELPIVCAGWLIIIILYAIFNRRSLRWYNFVILGVLLICWLASFFILFPLFFFNGPPGCWQKLTFIFPCIFKCDIHRDWMAASDVVTNYYFYANFLASLCAFITALVLFMRQRIKKITI